MMVCLSHAKMAYLNFRCRVDFAFVLIAKDTETVTLHLIICPIYDLSISVFMEYESYT